MGETNLLYFLKRGWTRCAVPTSTSPSKLPSFSSSTSSSSTSTYKLPSSSSNTASFVTRAAKHSHACS